MPIPLACAFSSFTGAGARVGLARAGQPTLWRRARTDGSYLSASDVRVHFGLGTDTRAARLVVEWPDGPAETFAGIDADRVVVLERGRGVPRGPAGK